MKKTSSSPSPPPRIAICDSVDEGGTVKITQTGKDWWKAMKGLDARNPEALRVGQGSIWATGKKGDIIEDKFFMFLKTSVD